MTPATNPSSPSNHRDPSDPKNQSNPNVTSASSEESLTEETLPEKTSKNPGAKPFSVGDFAPDFTLSDSAGNPVNLAALAGAGAKGVVVYFYPRASTPGCTKEACDFRDSLSSLVAAGFAVVGVSPDKPAALEKFANKQQLNFPLLSDPEKKVMSAWGAWGEKKLYGKLFKGVIRSTVVVGPDLRVLAAFYNVKASGHVARLRRELGLD